MSKPKAATNPADRLAALTSELSRLREQRDLVHAAPRSLEETVGDIPRVVERLAERFDPPIWFLANGPAGVGDLVHAMSTNSPNEHQPATPATVLAWVAPDLLRAALERDVARIYETLPTPMAAAAKAAELRRIETEIGRIEGEITAAWWASVDAGMTLPVPSIPGSILIGLQ